MFNSHFEAEDLHRSQRCRQYGYRRRGEDIREKSISKRSNKKVFASRTRRFFLDFAPGVFWSFLSLLEQKSFRTGSLGLGLNE